jgi:hypothetical protein
LLTANQKNPDSQILNRCASIKQQMDTMLTVLFVAILIIPVIWLCLSIKWRKEESNGGGAGNTSGQQKRD